MELVNRNSYKKFWMAFYVFLIFYISVMIYLCLDLNIWMDEAYTLDTTSSQRSLSGVIHQSYYFESQPPVYFILLWLWRKISATVVFARMFSLVSIGMAAWYFFRSARLISGTETSKWLVILFLLNPFTVFAVLEIRLYAFLLLLSTMAVYHYMKYYTAGIKKHLFIFLIISLVGLYTQYFFAFLIAGFVFSTLVFKGFKQAVTVALYILPVILLFLPNVLFMNEQLGMVQSQKQTMSFFGRMALVIHSPQNLILSLETLFVKQSVRRCLLVVFAIIFFYSYIKALFKNTSSSPDYAKITNFSILSAAAIVAVLTIFIAITGIDHQDKYLTIALPLFILSFAHIGIHGIIWGRILFATFVLYYLTLFIYHYNGSVKQYDYKGVANYVEKNARPGEPIMFYHSTIALPFKYYYRGANTIAPLPHEIHMDTTYMANVEDTAELKNAIENIKAPSNSYLLVSDLSEPKYKDDPNRIMVNSYLASHYKITLDTLYAGDGKQQYLRIRRLEKK